MKTVCDRIEANVPSNVLEHPGSLICPYFDPTMLAAESPIPIEITPLKRIKELVWLKSGVSQRGSEAPAKR